LVLSRLGLLLGFTGVALAVVALAVVAYRPVLAADRLR
jgi:hypothetical protein